MKVRSTTGQFMVTAFLCQSMLWQRTILGKGAVDATWLPHVSNLMPQLIIFLPTQK